MSGALLAEFADPATMRAAAANLKHHLQYTVIDAFTPYPVDGLDEQLPAERSRIRVTMLVAGFSVAAVAFALQWYSAVISYPINSGGRPLNSLPVFVLVPFEIGIFAAALAGFMALLWATGLPRLHDPLFDISGFERATQDHYFLLASGGDSGDSAGELRELLRSAGAVRVTEVRRT